MQGSNRSSAATSSQTSSAEPSTLFLPIVSRQTVQPVSQDFTLPAASPNGKTLTPTERENLLARTGSQTFFSRELCAKYFTYTDSDGRAHFVLYDDASTLEAKLAQLAGCGVQTVFALFPDAAGLLKPS